MGMGDRLRQAPGGAPPPLQRKTGKGGKTSNHCTCVMACSAHLNFPIPSVVSDRKTDNSKGNHICATPHWSDMFLLHHCVFGRLKCLGGVDIRPQTTALHGYWPCLFVLVDRRRILPCLSIGHNWYHPVQMLPATLFLPCAADVQM